MLRLNAFPAISSGAYPRTPQVTHANAFEVSPTIANLLYNSVSNNQSFPPPRDLPLRSHLVRLLVGSDPPVKKPGDGPESV